MSGDPVYHIEYIETVVEKDIAKLTKPIRLTIKTAIEKKLMTDPIEFGKPLRYSLKGHRRLRVGDYRVVYRIIPESQTVLIIAIKHRKDVYEDQ